MDDLDPVPHACHAAVVRSQLAHADVTVDATAALALPGVVGVLTGEDVAELSRPFPAGIDSPVPFYSAAVGTARYMGEPLAVVVARDRYVAEDGAELVAVDYDPLDAVLDPGAAEPIHDRSFHYGDVDEALAAADLVVRETFRVPRWSCTPVECYGVVAAWHAAAGSLTVWANFQGPFTLHTVAAAALGLSGAKLRLITPPDSGGSFGIKSSVFSYVVLMGLASRKLGVPVKWTEDRLEHLAGSACADGARHRHRGGIHARRRAGRASLRRARGRRRLRPGAGAGHALPDARLALRRVPRPERRRPQPRRAHQPAAERPEPRLRRAAALLRARADDGDRRAAAGARPGRGGAAQPRAGRRVPVRDAVGRPLRLRRLRGVPRRCARAGALGRARARRPRRRAPPAGSSASASPASSSRRSRTWATSRWRRPRSSAPRRCRSPATPRARPWPSRRSAGSPCASARPRRARDTGRSARRSSPTSSASSRPTSRCWPSWTRPCPPGRSRPGNYSSRFSGVGAGAVQAAARKLGATKVTAIREHLGDPDLPLRRVAGVAHWHPDSLPDGHGAGPARDRLLRRAEPRRRRTTSTASPRRPPTGSSATSPSSRSTRETGEVRCSTTSPSTTPDGCSTRCSRTGRSRAASRTAPRPRSSSGTRTTSGARS